ncbi:asparaginase [Faecalibaculum rodentium]|uniref:asparaginase n=2 Tax=Faecalibaculum rodentium TaxID=1702221 RepID=UPI0025A1A229|nr:asparaginase [Faecalibaculum rodentium]
MAEKKKIAVIATGGTIAGTGPAGDAAGYRAGELPVEEVVSSVPGLGEIADLEMHTVCQVDSNDITFGAYREVKNLVEQLETDPSVDGVVITHGTDTLEETAFLLNLVLDVAKPVVITGAMRPATATSADGPANLMQAVRLAADDSARGMGVLAVFSNMVFAGRDVKKTDSMSTDAFRQNEFGLLGYVRDRTVSLIHRPYRFHTSESRFNDVDLRDMPRVEIFYVHEESDPGLLRYMLESYDGVVIAGTGAGNYPTAVQDVIEGWNGDCMIVRSSRLPEGEAVPDGVFDPRGKTIAAYDLMPHKARLLLMLGLKKEESMEEIQEDFRAY